MHPDDDDLGAYVAGLLADDQDEPSGTFSMSLRLPVSLAAAVMVMAEQAGKSRNEMARLIIQTGFDDIVSRLPHPIRDDLNEAIVERVETLL